MALCSCLVLDCPGRAPDRARSLESAAVNLAPPGRRSGRDAGVHVVLATLFIVTSGRLALAAWTGGWLGLDARIYYRGSAAWVAGTTQTLMQIVGP